MDIHTEIIRATIIGILLGEGGLSADFCYEKQDKSLNLLMQKIKNRILSDNEFKEELTNQLVEVYNEKCNRLGVPSNVENVAVLLYPYQCCLQAASISAKIFAKEDNLKR